MATLGNPLYSISIKSTKWDTGAKSTKTISALNFPQGGISTVADDLMTFANRFTANGKDQFLGEITAGSSQTITSM